MSWHTTFEFIQTGQGKRTIRESGEIWEGGDLGEFQAQVYSQRRQNNQARKGPD
ncbi:MAG: hypothetical protein ACRC91_07410 [Aeromonas sp.]